MCAERLEARFFARGEVPEFAFPKHSSVSRQASFPSAPTKSEQSTSCCYGCFRAVHILLLRLFVSPLINLTITITIQIMITITMKITMKITIKITKIITIMITITIVKYIDITITITITNMITITITQNRAGRAGQHLPDPTPLNFPCKSPCMGTCMGSYAKLELRSVAPPSGAPHSLLMFYSLSLSL